MTGIRAVAAAATLGLAVGCSDESGIIAEVWLDPAVSADVQALEFALAVFVADGAYRADDESFQDHVHVSRDLRFDPFRLFVKDDVKEPDARLMVIAVGLDETDTVVAAGRFPEPHAFVDGEVRLHPLTMYGYDPTVIGVSEGCAIWFEAGRRLAAGHPPAGDADCDGDADAVDCGPEDPAVGPTVPGERCDDGGADANCNGSGEDPETCDNADNDCDGVCDDGLDGDGDGHTACGGVEGDACTPDPTQADCDDGAVAAFPGAEEKCDGLDNDCDGACDEGFDEDGDSFTDCPVLAATPASAACNVDCAPDAADVYPGAAVPCYRGIDECATGVTSCLTIGNVGFGECLPSGADILVPAELCSQYRGCLTGDAWAGCWDTVGTPASGDPYYLCAWPVQVDGGPCPGSAFLLQVTSGPTCTVQHVVDTQDSVRVNILEPAECMAELQVVEATLPPMDDFVVVVFSTAMGLEYAYVLVSPFTVDTCPSAIDACMLVTP